MNSEIRIRSAEEQDLPLILQFIRDLAEYERLAHEVVATEDRLRASLFGPRPGAEVVFAEVGDKPAGFALFFHNYSTFLAQRGLYLEDLFVRPEFRLGIGRRPALLHSRGARLQPVEWWVLIGTSRPFASSKRWAPRPCPPSFSGDGRSDPAAAEYVSQRGQAANKMKISTDGKTFSYSLRKSCHSAENFEHRKLTNWEQVFRPRKRAHGTRLKILPWEF
jgi:hypothetical protein